MADPIYIERFFTGLYSNRSPLITPFTFAGLSRIERHDALIDGLNVEINDQQTLQRRPGWPKYCTQQLGGTEIPRNFYTWRDGNGTLKLVADLTANISTVTTAATANLLTAGSVEAQFQAVGATLYIAAGTTLKKYTPGDGLVTNWGIVSPSTAATIAVTNSVTGAPTAAAGTNWTNPTNALTSNDSYATYNAATQDALKLTTFGFSLPTSVTITGFAISVEGNGGSATEANRQIEVAITTDGATAAGTWQDITLPLTTDSTQTVGSATNLLGVTTATKALVEGSTFGVLVRDNDTTASTFSIDYVSLTAYFSVDDGLLPTNGYRWVYVFKNSATGHISSASTESASTGVLSRRSKIVLSGASSSDTQVDQIEIYRTKDGGSVYYFVATLAHSVGWSYTDTTDDEALDTETTAPLNGLNDPPTSPMHLTTFHMGRMWGAVDNTLYFGGGGDILNGVPEECWPPTNYFIFPAKLQALLPTQFGLLVFTASDCYVIQGIDTFSFFPRLWQAGLGVLSPHCVTLEGEALYIYTSQRQFLCFSNTREEIGFNIADKLLTSFAPSSSYIAAHKQGSDTAIYISNGSDSIYRYARNLQSWSPVGQPVGGCKAIRAVEVADGDWRVLLGRAVAQDYILWRDVATFADAGSPYSAYATFGSLVLVPPKMLSTVDAICLTTTSAGTFPTVSILAQEISGTFTTIPSPVDEPPQLLPSTTAIAKRHNLNLTAVPRIMQHLQVKVTFASESAKNELLALGIDLAPEAN